MEDRREKVLETGRGGRTLPEQPLKGFLSQQRMGWPLFLPCNLEMDSKSEIFLRPLNQAQTQQARHCHSVSAASLRKAHSRCRKGNFNEEIFCASALMNPTCCSAWWLWVAVPAPHLLPPWWGRKRWAEGGSVGSGKRVKHLRREECSPWSLVSGHWDIASAVYSSLQHIALLSEHNTSFFLAKLNYSLRDWEFCTIFSPFC